MYAEGQHAHKHFAANIKLHIANLTYLGLLFIDVALLLNVSQSSHNAESYQLVPRPICPASPALSSRLEPDITTPMTSNPLYVTAVPAQSTPTILVRLVQSRAVLLGDPRSVTLFMSIQHCV